MRGEEKRELTFTITVAEAFFWFNYGLRLIRGGIPLIIFNGAVMEQGEIKTAETVNNCTFN